MPSGIFLKIFLWFWLAMTLVGGTFVVSVELTRPEPGARRWREFTRNALNFYLQRGTEILQRGGRGELLSYLERLKRTSEIEAMIFDSSGREISGRPFPPGIHKLVARARASHRVELQRTPRGLLVARSAAAADGQTYTLVGGFLRPFVRPRAELSDILLRLLAVVMVGGVVCYGLARYLTSPVTRLQKATRQLAQGNLSTRVGSLLERRGDEFADLGKDFDLMAERIGSLLKAQRTLLRDISHELRSPLARLSVALELARQRAGQEARASLDRVELETQRMNELIGELLTLARLEDHLKQGEEVSLATLVEEVVADANFEAAERNRSVRLRESQQCVTKGSGELLRSAIENVVRNALRYTAENTQVEVALRASANQASLVVRDHGPGVPQAALGEIFRPFYRLDEARDRQSGGIGLGLAIAERVLRFHGGTISAKNAPEGGLIVELRLPASSETPGVSQSG